MGAAASTTAFEAAAAGGRNTLGSAALSQSLAAAGSSASVPNRVLLYPHDFFKNGKLPKDDKEAARFWQYREDRLVDGSADVTVPPDGAKMLEEMTRIKSELSQYVQRRFDETALGVASKLKLTFTNGQCRQEPKTAGDLQNVVGELDQHTNENIITFWRLFIHPFLHGKWIPQVIDAWLAENSKALYSRPVQQTHPDTGKKIGRRRLTARGGWTDIATSSLSNRRRYYSDHLMEKRGWKVCKSGPRGSGQKDTHLDETKGLSYTKIRLEVNDIDNDNTKPEDLRGWLVNKVMHLF
jgi:hypothetical protein